MQNVIARQYGHIDKQGKPHIYSRGLFLSNIQDNPNTGIEYIVLKREGLISDQLRKYYFAVVVPELQKALFNYGYEISLNDVDYMFRDKSLYYEVLDEEKGKYIKKTHALKKSDTAVTMSMMKHYIDYCIRFAIQNLDWAIAYPNEVLNNNNY